MIPVQQTLVPVQQIEVPVEQILVPAQAAFTPFAVPLQQILLPMQQSMVAAQQILVPQILPNVAEAGACGAEYNASTADSGPVLVPVLQKLPCLRSYTSRYLFRATWVAEEAASLKTRVSADPLGSSGV